MEQTQAEIRPRNLGGIIGDSFQTYIDNFARYAGTAAIVMIPLIVVSALLWAAGSFATTQADGWPDLPRFIVTECLFPVGTFVLFVLLYPLLEGALIYITSQSQLGQPVNIGNAFTFAWRRIGDLTGTLLLRGLLLAVMLVSVISLPLAIYYDITWLFILSAAGAIGVPFAIYLGIKWLFASQVVTLERVGPIKALGRSGNLAAGSWWRIFGIIAVVDLIEACGWIVVGILFSVFSAFAGGFHVLLSGPPAISMMVGQVVVAVVLLTPLVVIADTLLYFDLRVRKEQYTITSMASELGTDLAKTPSPKVGPALR